MFVGFCAWYLSGHFVQLLVSGCLLAFLPASRRFCRFLSACWSFCQFVGVSAGLWLPVGLSASLSAFLLVSGCLLASLPVCRRFCRSLVACWPFCRSAGLSAALLACCLCLGLPGDSRLPFFLSACAWSFAAGGHIATLPLICAASIFSLACLSCPAFSSVVHVDILLINARACVYFISFIYLYSVICRFMTNSMLFMTNSMLCFFGCG